VYLFASPDPHGRFGHQTAVYVTGLILAHLTESFLVKPTYKVFADKWNDVVRWESDLILNEHSMFDVNGVCSLGTLNSDQYGNRKWDLTKTGQVRELLNKLTDLHEKTLVILPFDQFPGRLLQLLKNKDLGDVLSEILGGAANPETTQNKYACIHIRRGDCTQNNHPFWFVHDELYIHIVRVLDKLLPIHWEIKICTQGHHPFLVKLKSEILDRSGRVVSLLDSEDSFINDQDIRDYFTMMNASLLFTPGSWFSTWAGYANKSSTVVEVARRPDSRPFDFHINPDDTDATIDECLSRVVEKVAGQELLCKMLANIDSCHHDGQRFHGVINPTVL
jgi:hypothetical protein